MGGMIVVACIRLWPDITYPDMYGGQLEKARWQIIGAMIFWLPLSTSVAFVQWLKLSHWNISGAAWILGTTLAWVLPPAFLPLILDGLHILYFDSSNLGGQVAQLILAALSVGTVQSLVLRGPRRMSASWIIACLLGSLALATLALFTWGVGFGLGKSLVPFLLSRGEIGLEIVGNRDWLLLSLVYLILPIWAALVIGLPTGLVFSKYRVTRQPDMTEVHTT